MYFQKRGNQYSLVYYDKSAKKNRRMSQRETAHIQTDEEAKLFCREWDEKNGAEKVKVEEKLKWQKLFPHFIELLSVYERCRKEEAENSWMNSCYFLKYYAFDFFLVQKLEPALDRWRFHFEEFRDFLRGAESIKRMRKSDLLALSTVNSIIKALNSFLLTMHRRNEVEGLWSCRLFPKSKLNSKAEECVIGEEDQRIIHSALEEESQLAADFFQISLRTGMRLNEVMGLSLGDFFPGFPNNEALRNALAPLNFKVYGFISLESQPALNPYPRDSFAKVLRKPLKGKKEISASNARTIPIFDTETYNTIVRLWNKQQALFSEQLYGPDPKDYLLFNDTNTMNYYYVLVRAQQRLKLRGRKIFSPHDCRHTYSTWLAEKTGGNFSLCRLILGHSSLDITFRYVHMAARIQRHLQTTLQLQHKLQPLELRVG